MRELAQSTPKGSRHNADNDKDIFTQVLGKEKLGHVRMRGLDVFPIDLWGTMPSHATAYKMAMEFKTSLDKVVGQYDELHTRYERMESMFMNGGRHGGTPSNPSSEPDGSSHSHLNRSSEPDVSSQRQMGHSSSTAGRPTIRACAIVSLKIIVNSDHVVAKGIIFSIDPETQVGAADLGRNCCEVQVHVDVE